MSLRTSFADHFVTFQLNSCVHKVSSVPADTSLNTYIREYARLKGTKFMCREGGCGACIVNLEFIHAATGETRTVSVNSCMFPVYACHGYKVTTVEGIGSKQKGYHEIQTRLTNFYGTQCGYCTPGWVMSMYSLLEANPKATMKEIEDSFSGNICRCTGYRPILDAFKSFASDKTKELEKKVEDIEDLLKVCKRSGVPCGGKCSPGSKRGLYDCVEKNQKDDSDAEFVEVALASPSLRLELQGGSQWYKVANIEEIFEIFGMVTGSYMLVGGNTAQGILKGKPPPDVYIDINGVGFLKAHSFYSGNLYVGANTTLADAIKLFNAVSDENPEYFAYTKELAKHIEKVANTHVRNVATIAGNLMIKQIWRHFPSDIFLILEAVGALLSVRGDNEAITLLSLPAFLETNMYKKVILQIILPPLNCNTYIVKTFKIAPRAQNSVAYVNGGFKFKVNKKEQFRVVEKPNIVFGGINPDFIHAYQTETFLINKPLLNSTTLQGALNLLGLEIKPDYKLPDAKPEFRRKLTQSLLYRVVLGLHPGFVDPKLRSGGDNITRPVSSGKQEYNNDMSMPPLYQAFPKLESLIQCSGEAEYVYDIPTTAHELYCAFVLTKQGPGTLAGIDPSKALEFPGVVTFISAKDIPGENTFTPSNPFIPDKEKLFADKDVLFAGQAVGLVVAETQEVADQAAELVIITITNRKKPLLDIRQIVKSKDISRIIKVADKPSVAKADVKKVVKGEWKMESQYHFTMETLSCLVVPVEDGLNVFCTTQWMQAVQEAIALLLNISENSINMYVRRVGGSYGGKLTRGNFVGCAVSLAAHLLNRPVRMVVKMESVMEAIGKRYPHYFDYEAGVNEDGEIQYLKTNLYADNGVALNDSVVMLFLFPTFGNVYESSTWGASMFDVKTDKPCNIWCRSPGTLEAVTIAEHIMEHIAHEVGKDPLSVRMKNLDKKYPIDKMIEQLREKSDYDSRKALVEKFNEENIWKKRGISLVPMRFPIDTLGAFHAMVSVYKNDGTVVITHGGVEIGQGINTKAAQVCAATLNIPLDTIKVKAANNHMAPNGGPTGGSFTSESVVLAVERCCQELNTRLAPVRATLQSPTWQALVQAAYLAQINLNSCYMFTPLPDKDFKRYYVFGVTVLEVEVDILTGEHKPPLMKRENEVEKKDPTHKVTSTNLPIRYHPYERTEEASREHCDRLARFDTDPAEVMLNNPLIESTTHSNNIDSHGSVVPWTNPGRAVSNKIDLVSCNGILVNGRTPATRTHDALLRRAIRGSHTSDVPDNTSNSSVTSSHLTASATNEAGPVCQPIPTRPGANSPASSPPAYTVELVSVAPGIQIQKKKFLPRYLPMPIGTPPGGLGRPILGRGPLLYCVTPQTDMPSPPRTREPNENGPQTPSREGSHRGPNIGDRDYDMLGAQLPKWPFSD